jgi:multiple sugar transport system substrate-binding protein
VSGVSLAGGSSLAVFKGSKNPTLALQLVQYLSRPEQQAKFYRLSGDLPARREAWADSALAVDREAEAFRIQLGRTVPTPMVPEWEQVTTKVMDRTEAAVRGSQTAAAALAGLDADVDRLLERRRFLLARRTGAGQ